LLFAIKLAKHTITSNNGAIHSNLSPVRFSAHARTQTIQAFMGLDGFLCPLGIFWRAKPRCPLYKLKQAFHR
jgi:hypothetical protein